MDKRCADCGQRLPEYGGIIADPEHRTVSYNGRFTYLSYYEFQVFAYLLSKRGRMATKEAILYHLYQLRPEADQPDIKIVDVWIFKIRKNIKPIGLVIGTARAQGFYLQEPGAPPGPKGLYAPPASELT